MRVLIFSRQWGDMEAVLRWITRKRTNIWRDDWRNSWRRSQYSDRRKSTRNWSLWSVARFWTLSWRCCVFYGLGGRGLWPFSPTGRSRHLLWGWHCLLLVTLGTGDLILGSGLTNPIALFRELKQWILVKPSCCNCWMPHIWRRSRNS